MNCSTCSCQLKNTSAKDIEGKIGIESNDKWYCIECHEAFLFAGDLVDEFDDCDDIIVST